MFALSESNGQVGPPWLVGGKSRYATFDCGPFRRWTAPIHSLFCCRQTNSTNRTSTVFFLSRFQSCLERRPAHHSQKEKQKAQTQKKSSGHKFCTCPHTRVPLIMRRRQTGARTTLPPWTSEICSVTRLPTQGSPSLLVLLSPAGPLEPPLPDVCWLFGSDTRLSVDVEDLHMGRHHLRKKKETNI